MKNYNTINKYYSLDINEFILDGLSFCFSPITFQTIFSNASLRTEANSRVVKLILTLPIFLECCIFEMHMIAKI